MRFVSLCSMCAGIPEGKGRCSASALSRTCQKFGHEKHLVFVSVIPKGRIYSPGQFADINIPKANRWLKDALKRQGLTDVMVGSADLGWENRRGGNYIQLHWHLVMWTDNPKRLKKKLKTIMPRTKPYERPVDVIVVRDHGFLAYMNKAIKLPELLRRNRKHLPELLLVLDRIEPLDLLVHE